jgi:hypothetical protein
LPSGHKNAVSVVIPENLMRRRRYPNAHLLSPKEFPVFANGVKLRKSQTGSRKHNRVVCAQFTGSNWQDNPSHFREVLKQYVPTLEGAQIDALYEAIQRDYRT